MKSSLVNWLPWSVLKISGAAVLGDGLFERLDAEIRGHGDRYAMREDPRVAQSMMATRYTKPRRMGM